MRIISGKYKGHHLSSFKADHIRPTTDRVKETLFNKWMNQVEDSNVVDLFSGTGNLGLESLSRGAAHVVFVESHPKSIGIIRENITKLKVDPKSYTVVSSDVLVYLKKYKGNPFDLILADPPFTQKMAHQVLFAASNSQVFGEQSSLAIESERHERLDDEYGLVIRYDMCKFGDKILSFFNRRPT